MPIDAPHRRAVPRLLARFATYTAVVTLLGATVAGAQAAPRSAPPPRYTVSFEAANPREVRVALELVVQEPRLEMDTTGLGGPAAGVAAFVRGLHAARMDGSTVPVRAEGPGRWGLDARRGEALRVTYAVTLGHDSLRADGALAHPWHVPVAELAFARPTLAYLAGRALFVTPPEPPGGASEARVAVRVPSGWRALTSWEPDGGTATFRVLTLAALREGFVVAGAAPALSVTRRHAGALSLEVVTWGPAMRAAAESIAQVAASALGTYAGVFGRLPATARGTPYRRVAIVAVEDDAPARAGSTLLRKDIVLLAPPARARAVAQEGVAHELFHLWSGRAFSHRTPGEGWFAEGVTAYYALHALRRAGALSDSGYTEALDAAFGRFRLDPWIGVKSIAQAGAELDAHRALVHDGGLLTAACMDPDIRTTTKGTHDLDDVMRSLLVRHDTGERRYGNAALFDAIRTVSDDAVARRIARVVEGSAPLALWRCATEPGRR